AREAAWLVPVPLGAGRLRRRGYNQSERLARALSRRWNRPVVELLVRTRETGTQTALTPEARLANVAGAFQVRNGECGVRNEGAHANSALRIPHSALERPLILVDDVFTTGATLAEAARALERAGARTVLAVTFGRALVPVPLGAGRLRQRGYNQSERLARALSRRWNRPVVELLIRTRETGTQTALTPEARLANVAGAFRTRNAEGGTRNERPDDCSAFRLPSSAFQRPLVLVDDVFTTGATLAEAARALQRAGARTVLAVTFGRAVVPDFT
ncbi:MAG TPA: hypothetical protein VIV88_15005, partial [Gemmatimonadales bacterium]